MELISFSNEIRKPLFDTCVGGVYDTTFVGVIDKAEDRVLNITAKRRRQAAAIKMVVMQTFIRNVFAFLSCDALLLSPMTITRSPGFVNPTNSSSSFFMT